MTPWTFYPVFIGAALSFAGWMYLILKKHDKARPRTLSELAADEHALGYFRTVLWACGTLFALTLFLFIAPNIRHGLFVFIAGAGVIISEMLLGVFPARGRYDSLHNALSYFMGFAMGLLALGFATSLRRVYVPIEAVFTCAIAVLGIAAMLDRPRFIYYEMPFIFLSHISIVVAALALR